jgi:hypothetical protein
MQPDPIDATFVWTPEQLDTPAETLADRFGVSLATAQRIVDWHEAELASVEDSHSHAASAGHLHRILAWLLGPGDAKAKAVALCFAADLQPLIGWHNLSDAAADLGTTSANLSKLQTEIQAWLALPETQWNKTKYKFQQSNPPILKEMPTVERVAHSFRRWHQRVDVSKLTPDQITRIINSLSEIVRFTQSLTAQ